MIAKQFYISLRMGNMERIVSIESPEFAKCVKRYGLNTLSLGESELELLKGTLTVLGLLDQFVSTKSGSVCVNYGSVPDCDYDYD